MQKPKSETKSPSPPGNPSPKTAAPKSNRTSAAKPKRPRLTTKKAVIAAQPEVLLRFNGSHVATTTATGETGTALVVAANGSNMLGRPVFMEPTSEHAVANNLIVRSDLDPQEPLSPQSPTIINLGLVIDAMTKGEDIGPYKSHIQQIASNQTEKSEVVRAYVNQANNELIADLVEIRGNSVRHLKRATRRNDVSTGEALVVWRMANEQLAALTKGLNEKDRAVDTVTVIEKIDYKQQQTEVTVAKRWEGTTPQGRELIRKKLWELKRKILAEQGVLPLGLEDQPPEEPEQEPTPAPS